MEKVWVEFPSKGGGQAGNMHAARTPNQAGVRGCGVPTAQNDRGNSHVSSPLSLTGVRPLVAGAALTIPPPPTLLIDTRRCAPPSRAPGCSFDNDPPSSPRYEALRPSIAPLVALLTDEEDKTRANAAGALGNLVRRGEGEDKARASQCSGGELDSLERGGEEKREGMQEGRRTRWLALIGREGSGFPTPRMPTSLPRLPPLSP